jgi:hypothetical protein
MDFLWGVTVGFIIGALVFGNMVKADWRTDTVNRGLAIYCPIDGNWAWKGECK